MNHYKRYLAAVVAAATLTVAGLASAAPSGEFEQLPLIEVDLDCSEFPDGITPDDYAYRKAGQRYDQLRPGAGAGEYLYQIRWRLTCGVFIGSDSISGQVFKNSRQNFATVFRNVSNKCVKINRRCGNPASVRLPESNQDLFGERTVFGELPGANAPRAICFGAGCVRIEFDNFPSIP